MMGGGMGGWMFLMPMMGIVFWGLIVWLIVSVVRPGRHGDDTPDAVEIARRRYATGAISQAEFERLRDELSAVKRVDRAGS
jgi:uncharacterized membrane protein